MHMDKMMLSKFLLPASGGIGNAYASGGILMYEEGFFGRVRRTAFTTLLATLFAALVAPRVFAASSVTLAWDPSSSSDVTGYNVYYGPASRTYTNMVTAGNATNVTISGLVAGSTYFFAATAYDSFGVESDYSNETNYVPPVSGNQAPTLNAIANLTINEDAPQQTVNLSGITSGSPSENQTLTVTATSDTPGLIPNPTVIYTSPNATGTLRFTPVANASGRATITVTVNDGQASNNLTTRTFTVTVNAVNDPPTITAIPNQTIQQDGSTGALPFTVGDVETAAGGLVVASTSSNPTLVPQTGIAFGGSGSSRSITVTPAAGKTGTATITVSVSDGSATTDTSFSVTVQTGPPPSITITVNGKGKVTPNLSAAKIVAGAAYTITAVPDVGQEFAGWTGTLHSMSPRLTLKATNTFVLQANFVSSPFIPVAGTYNGLFYESDQVRQGSAGAFALTVTTKGKYTGRVQIGAKRYPFSGKFSLGIVATNSLKRATLTPLTLHLRVGTNGEIDQIFGDLSDGTWTSPLSGDRALYNSRTNLAPEAGLYTFFVPGSFDSSYPRGSSYGTVRVSTSGVVTYAGSLADGSHVSAAAPLSKNGVWPVYASLYAGTGSLLSWQTFSDQSSSDISGQLSWIKPANAKSRYFPDGFDYVSIAAGSAFHAPTSTNEVLAANQAAIDFSGGNLAADFSNLISIGAHSKVTNLSSNKLSMGFALTTGIYHGLVTDPTSGHAMPFSGAVFQKLNVGYGFLLGTDHCSGVEISP